jgi:hypothetical protein
LIWYSVSNITCTVSSDIDSPAAHGCRGVFSVQQAVFIRWHLHVSMNVTGTIIEGYRVASGDTDTTPYPESTIVMQTPFFKARGLDISRYYPATLNISIKPHTFKILKPMCTFELVKWSDIVPPETFSFAACRLVVAGMSYECLVYYPHPETKPDHFQDPSTIELLAPYVDSLAYGDTVTIEVNPETIEID